MDEQKLQVSNEQEYHHAAVKLDLSQQKAAAHVLRDVNKRISDWVSMGGSHEDAYIQQQLRYMQHIANLMEME